MGNFPQSTGFEIMNMGCSQSKLRFRNHLANIILLQITHLGYDDALHKCTCVPNISLVCVLTNSLLYTILRIFSLLYNPSRQNKRACLLHPIRLDHLLHTSAVNAELPIIPIMVQVESTSIIPHGFDFTIKLSTHREFYFQMRVRRIFYESWYCPRSNVWFRRLWCCGGCMILFVEYISCYPACTVTEGG